MVDFEKFNEERKKTAKKLRIGILLIVGGMLSLIFGYTNNIFVIIGIIALVAGLIISGLIAQEVKKLNLTFKMDVIKKIFEQKFEQVSYYPDKGLSKERIYRDGLMAKGDTFKTEDLVEGVYKGVKFTTCDLKLEEKRTRHTKNGVQTYYVVTFLGRFFEFEFPKSFKGKVVLTEAISIPAISKLKKTELESMEFNKKFKTYTNDELSAFYVLTPHLMESLLELEKANPGTISCSFIDNRLSLAIHNNKDTFEINIFNQVDARTIAAIEKDVNVISNIIEELRLNRNIFN